MQAIVTALDEPWRERVEEIWAELKAVFGVTAAAGAADPHLTYHMAEHYDESLAGTALERLAAATPPFEFETRGLTVLRGVKTVLALEIGPSPELLAMHSAVFHAADSFARNARGWYAAETWAPHITLAAGSVLEDQLPDVLALLSRRDYRWRLPATNLCLVPDASSRTKPWIRWELADNPWPGQQIS